MQTSRINILFLSQSVKKNWTRYCGSRSTSNSRFWCWVSCFHTRQMLFALGGTCKARYRLGYAISTCIWNILLAWQISLPSGHKRLSELLKLDVKFQRYLLMTLKFWKRMHLYLFIHIFLRIWLSTFNGNMCNYFT